MLHHPIPPVFDERSRILILGSFPSVQSRKQVFFYSHPQNRFWKVLAAVYGRAVPETVEEKRKFLLSERIALWDVIAACDVTASADSSIQNVIPNDLTRITAHAQITAVFVNGKTAEKYYYRYLKNTISVPVVCLPSTSPANASWSLEGLTQAWKILRDS